MSDTLLAAIVGAIAGIITGAVGSLFAPWANWGVEKRRTKQEYRRNLIKEWRALITKLHTAKAPENRGGPLLFGQALAAESAWQSLRPYLSPKVLEEVEAYQNHTFQSMQHSPILVRLTDEIGKLEKKWDLV